MRHIKSYMDHIATVGMAIVLLALTTVSILSGVATQRAGTRVADAVAQNAVLHQAFLLMNEEALLQNRYYLRPTVATRRQFDEDNARVVDQVGAIMRVTAPRPSATDHAAVSYALSLQARFVVASHAFFGAVDRKDMAEALALDNEKIEPLFATMKQVVTAATNVQNQQLAAAVQTLADTTDTVRRVTIATFLPGLALLLIFGLLFRGYRRQIAAATRAEMDLLQRAALTDHLSGLGNHRAFAEEESRALSFARRDGTSIAMALIDIDDFKQINDQHDHSYGDRILAGLGAVLRGGRASDRAFRIGGDEFAMILPVSRESTPAKALERIREAAERTLLGATISVGIAVQEPGVTETVTLRERADAALYEAKRRGRNTVVSFGEFQINASLLSVAKIAAVRRLIDERHLSVAFQPIWHLEHGAILGYEALARPSEEYGLEGPQEAFDIAEHIGRAAELDAVCREAILARSGELPDGALLFLNLSPQSLDHAILAGDRLVRAVTDAGLTASQVVLEITERSLARPAMVSREAGRLHDLGFLIALDDVGVGSTGLEMLRLVPVDYIKIDHGIVAGALTDTTARSVLAAILAFARESHTFVIAEGIETEAMLEAVDDAGKASPEWHVQGVQGYLSGRPSLNIVGAPARILLPRRRTITSAGLSR
jgi:diguanylate cyclase (GGDEF)-like protein